MPTSEIFMFRVVYFSATRSCVPEQIVSVHTQTMASHKKNLSPPAMVSTKKASLGSSRQHLRHPCIPRIAHLSLQNPQGYSSHQFHHLEDRMENPRNCPILTHLSHTAVFSNRNILHYLQRIVARYKNSRSCCEITGLRSPSSYTWNTLFSLLS